MTREEIEEKIEELEKQIEWCKLQIGQLSTDITVKECKLADLQAQLEQCGKRWRAGLEERYYFVDVGGFINQQKDYYDSIREFQYNTGNYFRTLEETEEYKKALLMVREKECSIDEFFNGGKYHVELDYEFETEEQQKEIAKALRKLLCVKE